jgi:protein-S-isoprenylcysteine O-methyltransferase Ste14
LAITSAAAIIVYFVLAVVGEGGFAAFFSRPPLIAMTLVYFALSGAALLSAGNLSRGEREDRSNRWVIPVIGVIGLLSVCLPPYMDRRDIWTIDGDTFRWIGVCLFALGGVLRLWPVFVLGRRFSGLVAIQSGHTLVTTGIYEHIRNPSYLGLLVNALGWALVFRSVVGVLLAVLLIPPLVARMRSEEALLHQHFGSEYDAYTARSWRLIPGLY